MNTEFRPVIHYCFLREMNAKDIFAEMKSAYKGNTPGESTIYKWLKRFKEGRETLDDDPRSGRPINNDENEAILRILEEQPFASSRYISGMLSIPKSTVCHKLVWQLNYRKLNFRWIPHELKQENKNKRVEMSKDILNILEGHESNWCNITTGDECWIYWDNDPDSQWLPAGQKRPLRTRKTIASKKTMFSIFFSLRGFLVVKTLPPGKKFNSQFMQDIVIPELCSNMKKFRVKNGAKGTFLHMDNATCHKSKSTQNKIALSGIKTIPHPPYSPDLSPCDFWLFGRLKEFLKGNRFQTEKELFDKVQDFLNLIKKDEISKVYEEWIERLHKVIELQGEYIL